MFTAFPLMQAATMAVLLLQPPFNPVDPVDLPLPAADEPFVVQVEEVVAQERKALQLGDNFFLFGTATKERTVLSISAITAEWVTVADIDVEDEQRNNVEYLQPSPDRVVLTEPGKYWVRITAAGLSPAGELFFRIKKLKGLELRDPIPDDVLTLAVTPAEIVEGKAATLTVKRTISTYDQEVSLSAAPADRASIASTINFPKGQLEVSTSVQAIDNIVEDDSVTVTVTASAPCCTAPVSTTFGILDDDGGPVGCDAVAEDEFGNIGRLGCTSMAQVPKDAWSEKQDVREALLDAAKAIRDPRTSGIITIRDAFDRIQDEVDEAVEPKAADWQPWRDTINAQIATLNLQKADVDNLCEAIAKGLEK